MSTRELNFNAIAKVIFGLEFFPLFIIGNILKNCLIPVNNILTTCDIHVNLKMVGTNILALINSDFLNTPAPSEQD